MQTLARDLIFGLRMLRKYPGTTALAASALALGIGLTSTMFSIVDAAFLRGLPFDHPDRLIYVGEMTRDRGDGRPGSIPVDDLLDLQKTQTAFESVAAWNGFQADVAADGVSPVRYSGARLTANLLRTLHTQPAIGRDFVDADAVDGAAPVIIIGDTVWENQFGRDPGIVNRVIRVNGAAATVIGVMPAGFGFPNSQSVWMPLSIRPAATRKDSRYVDVMGRLKAGADMRAADQQMRAVAERVARSEQDQSNLTGAAMPVIRRFIGPQPIITLTTMLVAVFGVLLIACVNVTNLQLARAAERVREVAIRLSLGASRRQIVRQLLVEGLLVAAIGAIVGLAIAYAGTRLFMIGIADTRPPYWIIARLDARVLLFTAALTVIATLVSTLVPAFRVTRQDLHGVLKDSGRANTSVQMGRFTRALVAIEVMLSFVLLIVSGLMIKSVFLANKIVYPYRTDVYMAGLELPERDDKDDAAWLADIERLKDSLRRAPGVSAAALATGLPDQAGTISFLIDGEAVPAKREDYPITRRIRMSPEYFRVMGVKVSLGRGIEDRDSAGQDTVVVVSEDWVRKFSPAANPIGRRIQFQPGGTDPQPWWTIVGVVPKLTATARVGNQGTSEVVAVPLMQLKTRNLMVFASASNGDAGTLSVPLAKAVASFNPDMPLSDGTTVSGSLYQQAWPLRVFGSLFMSFGAAALVMAAAGLYGVMAFAVRRRTQEIGVRMALGADRGRILWMMLRQGGLLVGIGLGLGAGIGGWLGGQLKLLLFGVEPWDIPVFAATALVLGLAGLIATLLPARKAASVDPLSALRTE